MNEILYIIPTCNRAKMLNENIVYYPSRPHKIALINGCNPIDYNALNWPKSPNFQLKTILSTNAKGLRSLYATVIHGLGLAERQGKSVCVIEDDCIPIDGLDDKLQPFTYSKTIINMLNIPNRDAYYYAGQFARRRQDYDNDFDNITWIDGNFFIPAKYVAEARDQLLKSIDIASKFNKSSGVGRILSRYFLSKNFMILQPKKTWLAHGEHESILFKNKRKEVPLIAKFDNQQKTNKNELE
jgi:hypothetical protein